MNLKQKAHLAVRAAIRSGQLAPIDGTLLCVDCKNRPAEVYDHRNYSKPLDVAPVCERCNRRRGPALDWLERQAQESETKENVLDLAADVCTLANASLPDTLDPCHRRAAYQLLRESGWQPFLTINDLRVIYRDQAREFERQANSLATELGISHRDAANFAASLSECRVVAENLDMLMMPAIDIDETFTKLYGIKNRPLYYRVERTPIPVRINPATGKIEIPHMDPLGIYQDALERLLRHPKADSRRLGRCAICAAYFYKPRLSSSCCTRECVDKFESRKYYRRENERVERALALRQQGKKLSEIADQLGLKPSGAAGRPVERVQQYLAQGRWRLRHATQTT